jgi:AAHS family 4-hydroxybenzoate transporter-like MFS transporter
MAVAATLDVTRLIDDRKLSWFNWQIVIVCFFIALADGYDITATAFAGPSLIKAWGVQSMAAMGPVFSASLAGIFFGSLFFGWLGDRFGRRLALFLSCLVIGIFTLACAWATNLTELFWLRLIAGVGIGGMLPNVITLTAEFAPRAWRSTLVIIMFTGVTAGGALPGPIAARLIPTEGWPIMFLVGGVVPLVMAVIGLLTLPESLKFLVVRTKNQSAAIAVVRRMEPFLVIAPGTELIAAAEPPARRFSPALLFRDGLAPLTSLLWLLFVCNQMAFYFVNSWLPTVLANAHMASAGPTAAALFQIGGTVGGLVLARPLDRMGFKPICLLFALAVPATVLIGYASADETLMLAVVTISGFALLGLQFGLNAASALIYPTAFRSSGSGWAFGIGRAGAVSGPIIAGYLIAAGLSIQQLYLVLAVPLGIALIGSLFMAKRYTTMFKSGGFGAERQDAARVDLVTH